MDTKDILIVEALERDARQSLSALGKRIGLSQPAVSERVKRLEERGVIEGYAARVNLRAIGLRLQAVVRLRTTHSHIARCIERFESLPEIREVFRVTGEDCFFVRCAFAEPEDLQRVVDALAEHGEVATSVVLSHPVRKLTMRAVRR